MKRFLAIAVIWLGCLAAWMILGATLHLRTDSLTGSLTGDVYTLWGPPGRQAPPAASYKQTITSEEVVIERGPTGETRKTVQHQNQVDVSVALDASNVNVNLKLEQQRKGLMWFPTYVVDFRAQYAFVNDQAGAQEVSVRFPLNSGSESRDEGGSNASFDGFAVADAQGRPLDFTIQGQNAVFTQHFGPGERRQFGIAYRTRGTSNFRYMMAQGTGRVKDVTIQIDTNFPNVDFPTDTLSPTTRSVTDKEFHGQWRFASLVSTASVGIDLPQLLNPGPLAAKVTFFAPLSLLFFFFVVAILSQVRGHELHPMHYFLLSCAFFAFHLLFAYLVDRLAIVTSFAIASAVSVFLVVSYARLFVGWRFALREMGLAQVVYLVLFSYTFFWEGFTGLAITIGAVLTLFFVMQVTGRTSWQHAAPRRTVSV